MPIDNSKEAAQAEIAKLVAEAYAAIEKAEKIALEKQLCFSFDVAYGMGGTFVGDPEELYDGDSLGWAPSSQSC